MVVLYKFKNIKELKSTQKTKKLPHTISNIYSYQRESGDCNTVIGSRSRSSEGQDQAVKVTGKVVSLETVCV